MPHTGDDQEQKALAFAKKGIFLALLSGLIWSTDGLVVQKSGSFSPFNNAKLWMLIPLVCAGTHDFFGSLVITTICWRTGRLKELGRSFISKPGRSIIAGALFGSLLGMGGYMTALQLAEPAYVLPITSLYPAVAAILAVFILKEKIPPRAWVGLLFCIAGAVVIGYMPPQSEVSDLFYLGLGCALLAAIGWGAEGVCATSGMDFIEPVVALNIYYLVSAALYLGILLPLAGSILLENGQLVPLLVDFASSPGTLIIGFAGMSGSISYLFWYAAMNMTGVSRAMALNISYALWGILISSLFTEIEITRHLIAGALVIFIGMFLVIGNPKDMVCLRNIN